MRYLFIVLLLWSSIANAEVFTYIALTDTHTMDDASRLRDQVNWINDNKELKNIKFVTHSGDFISGIVGHIPYLQNAADEMEQIEVPYLTSPGNWEGANYEQVFGASNSYDLFSAGDTEFFVMGLEYMPSEDTTAWANNILNKHRNKMVILFTHYYFKNSDEYYKQMHDKLVSKHPNIFLVTSGHMARGCMVLWDETGVTNQVTSNYQSDYGVDYGACFNTQFRIYTIDTESGSIKVESFSPCSGYDRAPQADFELNMYERTINNPCFSDVYCGGVE